jgi:hypothetical protein
MLDLAPQADAANGRQQQAGEADGGQDEGNRGLIAPKNIRKKSHDAFLAVVGGKF